MDVILSYLVLFQRNKLEFWSFFFSFWTWNGSPEKASFYHFKPVSKLLINTR